MLQKKHYVVLVASVFVVATCGIFYELLLGTISSYFLGDSVLHFSLAIGFFMFFMGVGSFISRFFHSRLLLLFVGVELLLSALGGSSTLLLYTIYAYHGDYYYFYYFFYTAALGTLIGLEIPLVVRVLNEQSSLKEVIADVLSFDYVGALVASLLFPLLLLPKLGIFYTALLVGGINLLVAWLNIIFFRQQWSRPQRLFLLVPAGVLTLLLAVAIQFAQGYTQKVFHALFRDPVVKAAQTPYQELTLTQAGNDVRLFINGALQFSSVDEYRYHEALVHMPMLWGKKVRRVLVLGGGDGLAVREILRYPSVEYIALVDLDSMVTHWAKTDPRLVKINDSALYDPRVHIFSMDAFRFVEKDTATYDVVIIDLPDPNNHALGKLYSREFYSLLKRHLTANGIVATQATSPFFVQKAFWCIHHTLRAVFGEALPYYIEVPSFGTWGFVMAGPSLTALLKKGGREAAISYWQQQMKKRKMPSWRFLNEAIVPALFVFPNDMQPLPGIEVNSIVNQKLAEYYGKEQRAW